LELAGAEEDDEWGMMRDLDLAAVRKRNPATIVYTVLFVGILAALGYLMTREPGKAVATGPQAPKGNLHDAYSFESSATAFTWDSQPAGAVDISVTEKRKASGSSALQLKGNSPQAEAFYGTSLSGRNIRYKLTAKGGATGGKARFGLQWSGLGLDRWDVVELGSGLGAIEIVSSAPPWASSVRLGVRFETPATVTLDDVALVPQGSAASTNVEQNDFRITVTDGRALDVFHAGRPILANGRPIAFDSGGRALDASLTIQAAEADKEHVTVAIQGGGDAAMVGVELTEVAGYLARGGFRAFGDADGGTYYKGSFPETQRLDRSVRKLLVGPSGGAFAVIGNASNGRFESLAKTEGRTRTWTIRASAADGAATVRFKNDLRGETAEAQGALSQAQSLYNAKRYGEFLNQANRALAEFPFASRVLRDRLRDRVAEVNSEYAKILKSADSSLADYDEFRDVSSLDQVANALKTLRTLFQITPGEGPRGERLARLSNAAATRLNKALEKRHNEQAGAFMVQAEQLHLDQAPPEVYSAGLLFFHVSTFLSDSDKATDADAGLENISKSNPDLMRVLRKLGLKAGE
ncbi:MAG: hypothetical protein OER88_08700, partial [Planctomycetota bacterium]|nr:hypothetical protein [Planctomycetota bacterium]